MRGEESMRAKASGEERCVEPEFGPFRLLGIVAGGWASRVTGATQWARRPSVTREIGWRQRACVAVRLIRESGPLTSGHGRARMRCANFRSPAGREGRLPTSVRMGRGERGKVRAYPVGRGTTCSRRTQVRVPQAVVVGEPRAGWQTSHKTRGRAGRRWEDGESQVEVGERRQGGEC